MIYVRFAPGVSVDEAAEKLNAMGKALSQRAARGRGRDGRRQHRHAAERAQPAIVSPNVAPEHGLPAPRVLRPGGAQALAGRDRRAGARDPHPRVPGRGDAPVPRRAGRQRLRQRVHRAVRRRGPRTTTWTSSTRRPRRSPRSRAPCPAFATCATSLQIDYPEIRVDTDREKAGLRRASPRDARRRRRWRRRSATSTRPASGSTRHNGQSYYVVTFYDGAKVADTHGARRSCRCASSDARASRSCSAPTANIRRALGPIAVERNHLAARRARAHADRGARHRHAPPRDLETALQGRPAHAATSTSTSWARCS